MQIFEWIARNWQEQWLGNFAWWQGAAAVVQTIFAIALYGATRQAIRVSQNQVTLMRQAEQRELYQRRLEVFHATMGFLSKFSQTSEFEFADIMTFLRETSEAEFLFGKDVLDLHDELQRKASEHRVKKKRADLMGNDPAKQQVALQELSPLENWFYSDAFSKTKAVFKQYLTLIEV